MVRSTTLPRRRYGVPVGGPFDRESAALANALVGNQHSFPICEISGIIELQANKKSVFALVGTDAPQSRISLDSGSRYLCNSSGRFYLAIPGGCEETLARGMSFHGSGHGSRVPIRLADTPTSLINRTVTCELRFTVGPQADRFDMEQLSGQTFRVSRAIDRLGVRLGCDTPLAHTIELPSEPQCPGVIQVPPSGLPIILGPDGPTLGGYPKIAVVIDADLDRVGQLQPEDAVRFVPISLEGARQMRIEQTARLERRLAQIQLHGQLGVPHTRVKADG